MTWQALLFLYVAGFAVTGVVLATATLLAIRFYRELPKKPIVESIEALEERKRNVQEEYDMLRDTLAQARHDIEEGKRHRDWLDVNEGIIAETKRKQEELEQIEAKTANLIEEKTRLETSVRELVEREAALKGVLPGYEEKARRIDDLEAKLEDFQRRRSEAAEQLDRLEAQVSQRKEESEELGRTLERFNDVIETRRKELEAITLQHRKLKTESAQLVADIDLYRRQLKELAKKEETYRPVPDDKARVATVWEPVLTVERLTKPSRRDEEAMLEQVAEHFRACRMKFHDRVIRAFHTSLKIASESPLVVLAGISGTGKSALPRLYAEGMGLHFLNVSVQPSWDSPMDMLGFFNHLEGRYRATQLTRALAQMDRFGLEGNGRWPQRNESLYQSLWDRMLLVLLDEMNLARVEYYFSEFLSKLEIRRDIDPRVADQRQKVEIMLETGSTGQDQQLLPIYVGTNVLFVGTMNEDESTQTLSDKVVDRANVLRFGKPEDLKLDEREERPNGTAEFLEYRTWSRWVEESSELDPQSRNRVEEFISKCNGALEIIGKPFAYRTANAIRAYVERYPRIDERWLDHALADQIEQRVLPKLRGVDAHDGQGLKAIARVRRLVAELRDEILEKAIASGADERHEHQFVWRGVDRAREE